MAQTCCEWQPCLVHGTRSSQDILYKVFGSSLGASADPTLYPNQSLMQAQHSQMVVTMIYNRLSAFVFANRGVLLCMTVSQCPYCTDRSKHAPNH